MENNDKIIGLSSQEVIKQRELFGKNELLIQKRESFIKKVFHIITEPMFLLLIVAASIYFILGEARDGSIMLVFVFVIIMIEIYQEWKSDKTLNALRDLAAPKIDVIRDGIRETIFSVDLVISDIMVIEEGDKIPADAKIITTSDLMVDESSLTGESESVYKSIEIEENDDYWKKNYVYAGTIVVQGSAIVLVDKIGFESEYGKIGLNIVEAKQEITPLKKQTNTIVKIAFIIAVIFFTLTFIITFINLNGYAFNERIIKSSLSAITIAMALIPEEFPVVLAVFLSMGAWRLAQKNALVKNLGAVETLGATSVLCVDKTGTITMNKMSVVQIYSFSDNMDDLVETMGLACETNAYDPMEQAMLSYSEVYGISKNHLFSGKFIDEYPFTNENKMMAHIWHHDDEIIIAAKGSPEMIMSVCCLNENEIIIIEEKINEYSRKGLRVIAVAKTILNNENEMPSSILNTNLDFLGLIGLEDPPRENIKDDIKSCTNAGIRVVMITGDHPTTASAIAEKIAMPNYDKIITGKQIDNMSDLEFNEAIKDLSVFSRVLPEHKMKIVKAFKENNHIVAMSGDGVNDAPALKNADIGVAMGKHSSQVSREAADLVLLDDNFSTIVESIKDGRRIYDNIRKAVGYIFAIHIPIAFAALLAPLLGITSSFLLLLPLHVVLLELVIDPTCSIVLERQPAESDIMKRMPRNPNEKMLNKDVLLKSFIQGIVIFIASFASYYYVLNTSQDVMLARTMGIATIILANLFLVLVNTSDHDSIFVSLKRLSKDKFMWLVPLVTFMMLLLVIYTPLNDIFGFRALSFMELIIIISLAAVSVLWYEIVKMYKRNKYNK